LPLSIHIAPAASACARQTTLAPLAPSFPANKTTSASLKLFSETSSTSYFSPASVSVRFRVAQTLGGHSIGRLRSFRIAMICSPTIPTPTTVTFAVIFHSVSSKLSVAHTKSLTVIWQHVILGNCHPGGTRSISPLQISNSSIPSFSTRSASP